MRISLDISVSDVDSIARSLNCAAAFGECHPDYAAARDSALNRIVAQAAILHKLNTPAIRIAVQRDYASWGKIRHAGKLPKATHPGR